MTRGKKLVEVESVGPAEHKDVAAGILIAAGSPGVAEPFVKAGKRHVISHTGPGSPAPELKPPVGHATLAAYFPVATNLGSLKKRLASMGWELRASIYKDVDWVRKSRAFTRPSRVMSTDGRMAALIRPTWKKVLPKKGDVLVTLDPGGAFGTGSHATTRQCLTAMLDLISFGVVAKTSTMLDVGTGSGILAIAAKKLGFRRVIGLDVDPEAVSTAIANASRNRARVEVGSKPVGKIKGSFDVVVANILAGTLKELSRDIRKRVLPGGALILSGLLNDQAKGVVRIYEKLGMSEVVRYSDAEWTTIVLRVG